MELPASGPFYAGGPIPTALAATHLHGYEEERRTLVQLLNRRTPQRVGVLGLPQSGKTSLLLAIAPDLPTPRAHLDAGRLWPSTPAAFYRLLTEALGTRRKDTPTPQGLPADAYARLPVPPKGARGVLVLENADRLPEVHPDLLAALPLLADRLPVHLVLTGHVGPLEPHVTEAVHLHPFTHATTEDFLRRRFGHAGLTVADEAVARFHEYGRGRPDTLQRLGRAVWDRTVRTGAQAVGPDDVDAAVSDLVDHLPTPLVTQWAQVRGIMRDVFIAMCLYDLTAPTEIARRLGLEPKNIVVLLGRLATAHRLVDRVDRGAYHVRDPLLKHHVKKEWGSPILR